MCYNQFHEFYMTINLIYEVDGVEQDMRYIMEIAQDGSFSKAAERLYMTQPALSIAVKRVESALGAEIFDRSRHPMELTEAGQVYLDAARRVRDLERELAAQVEDLRNLQTGTLHLGGTHYLNNYIMAPVLAGFAKKYPRVQLLVTEDSSAGLIDALKQNAVDLILSCDPELLQSFQHRPAFYDHILLAVHKEIPIDRDLENAALSASDIMAGKHTGSASRCVSLARFQELEFILLQSGNNLYDRSRAMFDQAEFAPKIKLTLAQMVTTYRFANNGLGAVFISDRLVRSPRSNLRFFRLDSALTSRLFHFVLPERNYTSFATRTFMEFAAQRVFHLDSVRLTEAYRQLDRIRE